MRYGAGSYDYVSYTHLDVYKRQPSNHLATASTHYGVVKKRYTQSVLVNANGDGTDPTWNKTFLISGTNVYLYDREKKRVTMETMGDVNEGDIVFIKTYYNAPKEVVIIR